MVPLEITLDAPHIGLLQGSEPFRIIAEEQHKTMIAAVLVAKSEILPRTPKNYGILRKGMMSMIYGEEQTLVGRVFNPLGYALPIEGGAEWKFGTGNRKPGGKSLWLESLRLWAQRKFGVGEGEAMGIAFAVRTKLIKRGLAPRHMFALGMIAAKPQIRDLWDKCLARVTKRLAGK
jgi:hypothetical protein